MPLRSAAWLSGDDLPGFLHRASLRATGLSPAALNGRPVVGIANSWSELVHCNLHLRGLADAVRRGVLQAGGLPVEFPTISLGENLMKPTAMMYRNLMAMDVEESIRAYPLDAVVLLGGCDKTVPAQLMGAASANVPAIMVTGGPAVPAVFRGRRLGVGTDLWRYADQLRRGEMSRSEFADLEQASMPGAGHCTEMGTASTMATVTEALGMSLANAAAVPAGDARRYAAAEAAGARAVALATSGPRPVQVLTRPAFLNAATVLAAIGGSTNAIVHLLALARRVGAALTLDDFDAVAARTPLLVNVRPSGEHLFEDFYHAGGVPALLHELKPLLDTTALTVSGRSLGNQVVGPVNDRTVIASLDDPFGPPGALAVVRGNLAPRGAVIKTSAASPHLMRHRGPAVVFDSITDLADRIDSPDLAVTADSVLVLRNVGPVGGPGMPEWGQLPIPTKLLRAGITDMVRISDARMSGTAYGTTVLHVAPEAAVGGPLAAVRDGDMIELDLPARSLRLDLPEPEIDRRLQHNPPPPRPYRRGWGHLYTEHVLQADDGCDFDFLTRTVDGTDETDLPLGLLSGWHGGW
ncbi:Dihydroxy-acid dehydratase [Kribbella flavida DSM 17836]|uniref:Dihydroxy-acid dehydratase n=1 Tax=Kribbella flavida (strain DSM 17836 / JCM 10339 / NBRC 14399) TaxID=479435 RepID=D2PWT8_KRIFD|nr:dihydroxy-acid dehydratase [Kribbella flavida]ADB33557.1 Dihydroxy-acid dehydratase [Kribbella flavida DSM 17836]